MLKKIAFAAAGIALLVSPILVSAQVLSGLTDTCSAAPTVACLQTEIQELVTILTQLLGAHHQQNPTFPIPAIMPPPSTSSTIVVTAPGSTSGQQIAIGSTYQIAWHASNMPNDAFLEFYLVGLDGTSYMIPQSGSLATPSQGSYNWSVTGPVCPANAGAPGVQGCVLALPPGQYEVWIKVFTTVVNNQPSGLVTQAYSPWVTLTGSTSGLPVPVINSFTASPSSIVAGQSTTFSWSSNLTQNDISQNGGGCFISSPTNSYSSLNAVGNSTNYGPTGTFLYIPTATATYNLTCLSGAKDGSPQATAQATVTVGANPVNSSLTATNPNPVPSSIVAGGSTGITLGSFALQPSGEDMSLQQVGLDLQALQASPSDITHAYIYEGSALFGTVIFTGSPTANCPSAFTGVPAGGCYFATTTIGTSLNINPLLPQNAHTNFTIKADIAGIGTGMPGKAGDYVVIGLSDAEALGTNSGSIVNSGSAPSQLGARIFKSYPTVVQLPNTSSLTGSVGKQPILMRFSVTASPNGAIGIANIGQSVTWSNVQFSSLQIYGYTDAAFSQPISGFAQGGLMATGFSSGSSGTFTMPVSGSPTQPIEIPAGQTYYFELLGNVSGLTGNASVTATVNGSSSYQPLMNLSGGIPNGFIWSPNDNGTSQYSTNDWTNGDDVPGLPISGFSQTVTGSGTTPPPPASPILNYVSQTSQVVTVNYSNLPTGSTIVFVNQTSGQASSPSTAVSGSGTATIPILQSLAAGTYYLKAQDSTNAYLAQTVSFTLAGPAPVPPVSATATIDQSSLTTTSATPTLTGGATNTNVVSLRIGGTGKSAFTIQGTVSNGKWSAIVSSDFSLTPGSYSVSVYGDANTVLTTGTLVVGPAPTCSVSDSITAPSGSTTPSPIGSAQGTAGSVVLSWRASNATSGSGPSGESVNPSSGTLSYPYPSKSTTYTFTFSGAGGQTSCSASVSCSAGAAGRSAQPQSQIQCVGASAADNNANLANALIALQAVLQKILALLQ